MFLAKGYFRVGRILSIFWITLLSTLALSILFFSPSANASSLDNFIAANSVDKLEFCGIDISNRLFTVVFNNLDGSLSNEIVYDPGYHTISSDQSYIDIFRESMKSEDGSWAFVKINDNRLRIIHSTGRMTATLGNLPIHYSQGYNIYRDTLVITDSTQPVTHIDLQFSCDQTPRFRFTNNSDTYAYLSSYGSYHFWYSLANPPYYIPNMSNFSSKIYLFTGDVIYPQEYEGIVIDSENVDTDQDGLTWAQERQQGTLDSNPDTDGDGISDFIESIWFNDRDEVFCAVNITPYVCAYPDPLVKDLYLEFDWMYDGTRSYKPSQDQINAVTEAFFNQNIKLHVDDGKYGGGNTLPAYRESLYIASDVDIDFEDLKNGYDSHRANFNIKRYGIWRYMISGYRYYEHPNSSGVSEIGGDDLFISKGLIEDYFTYQNLDSAIAGTIIHEIGHSLCLSSTTSYELQHQECIHDGVDSDKIAYILYRSAMNYRYQLDTISYSDGTNGINDHDDWSAIKVGISNFNSIAMSSGTILVAPDKAMLAFNLDNAAPNEMTPEMSKEIYEDSQKSENETTDNVDNNISENSATKIDSSDSDSNLSERKKAEKNTSSLDQEKSEKTPNLVFAISIISSVILVATPTLLIVKRHRSAHKQKTLKPNNTKNKIVK